MEKNRICKICGFVGNDIEFIYCQKNDDAQMEIGGMEGTFCYHCFYDKIMSLTEQELEYFKDFYFCTHPNIFKCSYKDRKIMLDTGINNRFTVFLGGTCNDSKWRDKLIPMLHIKYFNPVVDDLNEEAQKREINERLYDDFLLYTITPKMIGVYSIAEVVEDSIKHSDRTVLCLLPEDDEVKFTYPQWKSLVQVAKMVYENGAVVFSSLENVANYLNSNYNERNNIRYDGCVNNVDGNIEELINLVDKDEQIAEEDKLLDEFYNSHSGSLYSFLKMKGII
jgi:hypothetical protein